MNRLVAMKLARPFAAEHEDEEEEGEDGYGIWPAQKKADLPPSPWAALPEHLLFNLILVRLPFSRLLELRSVSSSWLAHLSSRQFWFLWCHFCPNHNPKPNPRPLPPITSRSQCFDLFMSQDFADPSPSSRPCSSRALPCILLCSASSLHGCVSQWLKEKSIRYVQGKKELQLHRSPWFHPHENFVQVQEPHTLLACEGGLLLLARHIDAAQQLIVCNPLLRAHKVLPHPIYSLAKYNTMTGFIVDLEHNEYTVILYGEDCQVFCSKDEEWKLVSQTLFKNATTVCPPMLDGSFFWLSQNPGLSDYAILSAYHATQEVVTSVRMRYPHGITHVKFCHIWKDSKGLFTLAQRSYHLSVWQLDIWQWEQEEYFPIPLNFSRRLPGVRKYGNLHYFRGTIPNEIYICNLDVKKGCTTPPCPLAASFTDYYVFQPSYMSV